jgi:YidC/Oxa1 family membrane protein insertase
MDRNAVIRWIVIAVVVFVAWKWVLPAVGGKSDKRQDVAEETYTNAPSFTPDVLDPSTPEHPGRWEPKEGEICKIKGNRFDAEMSSRGAALTHFYLRDAQYAGSDGFDMSTTPDHERWRSLRTLFRAKDASDQLKFDRFDWTLERLDDTGCKFTYQDDAASIEKTITAGARPFELNVETKITNLTDGPKKHRFDIEEFAYRQNKEIKGSLGRVSPFQTEIDCARGNEVTRKQKDEFKEGWFSEPLVDRWAAVNNYFFVQALVPEDGQKPECRILAEDWYGGGQSRDDDEAGAIYHARLTYPERALQPKETATYRQIAFFGPKERDVLAQAAGGTPRLGDAINLGFFAPVAKVLVDVLRFFHDKITGNWGLSIIVMTICLRLLLFPLSIKQIKTTIAMRKLKPELDALNARYSGDPQAKNLAMMEMYRKHGVNPLGGCLPQLVQMPVWFAMYTTLQTAVEMYHTHFLWFTDLSAPDKYYVLPLVLGAFMIVQQRIVPQQGMDPMQQKMMMYMLPAVFTVMMLFLPAALGVYMLTNSLLGIAQQLVVERIAPRTPQPPRGEIVVKQSDDSKDDDKPARPRDLGKGKARV